MNPYPQNKMAKYMMMMVNEFANHYMPETEEKGIQTINFEEQLEIDPKQSKQQRLNKIQYQTSNSDYESKQESVSESELEDLQFISAQNRMNKNRKIKLQLNTQSNLKSKSKSKQNPKPKAKSKSKSKVQGQGQVKSKERKGQVNLLKAIGKNNKQKRPSKLAQKILNEQECCRFCSHP